MRSAGGGGASRFGHASSCRPGRRGTTSRPAGPPARRMPAPMRRRGREAPVRRPPRRARPARDCGVGGRCPRAEYGRSLARLGSMRSLHSSKVRTRTDQGARVSGTVVSALIGAIASAACVLAVGAPATADTPGGDDDRPVVNGCVIKAFTECEGADLSGADLTGADLTAAVWANTVCNDGAVMTGTACGLSLASSESAGLAGPPSSSCSTTRPARSWATCRSGTGTAKTGRRTRTGPTAWRRRPRTSSRAWGG